MSLDPDQDLVKLLAVPLDDISPEEMEQLRKFAEAQDWSAMRDQLVHYSQRYGKHLNKETKS